MIVPKFSQPTLLGEGDTFLRWLLLVRVAVVSSILAAALYIQIIAGAELSLQPLFTLLGLTFALSLVHLLLVRRGVRAHWLTGLMLSLYVVLDTALIYYVGGVQSPLLVVYLLTVGGAGLLLPQRGALLMASLAGISYGVMADLIYLGVIPPWAFEVGTASRPFTAIELYYRIFAVFLGSYVVAWGASALSARLQETREELREERVEVQRLEELNEQIIDSMSSGLIAADRSGTIVTVNGAAVEITGRRAHELIGKKVWAVLGDGLDQGPDLLEHLEGRLRQRNIYRTEQPLRTPGGEQRIIGMSVTRLGWRDDEEASPGDGAGAGWGAEGRGAGAASPNEGPGGGAASPNEGPGAGAGSGNDGRGAGAGSGNDGRGAGAGSGNDGRGAVGGADEPEPGDDHPDDDSFRGYIFMFQDLSDIKRMERELRLRDRMAVLGEMAGSIAHEIRNPLASISGSLQMLRKGQVPLDHPSAQNLMDIVVRESERLSRTIEQFLEYARPGSFEAEEVDLLEVARDTISLLRNSTELGRDHKLLIDAPPGDYVIVADGSQMRQVFWNLARNAIQAMPDGGALTISLERRRRKIRVVFEDEGVGMTPEEVERFFQPYVTGTERGTGLGLAVVYRILERHGANVEVESEPGQGTRFVLGFEGREGPSEDDAEQLVLLRRGQPAGAESLLPGADDERAADGADDPADGASRSVDQEAEEVRQ